MPVPYYFAPTDTTPPETPARQGGHILIGGSWRMQSIENTALKSPDREGWPEKRRETSVLFAQQGKGRRRS